MVDTISIRYYNVYNSKNAPKNLKQALLDTGKQSVSEGAQEGTSYLANSALDYAYKDPNAKIDGMELLANVAGGAVTGGLLGGGANIIGKVNSNSNNIKTNQEINLPLSENLQFDNAVKQSVEKIPNVKLKESAQRVLNVLKDKIFNNGKIMTFKEQLNSDQSRSITTQPYLVKDVLIDMPIEELNNKPVIISQSIVDKVRAQHGVSDDLLGNLDTLLQDPVAIVQSYSKDNEGKYLDAYMIFMDAKDHKNRYIQAVVYPKSTIGNDRLEVDSIGSIYGRDMVKTIDSSKASDRLVWTKKEADGHAYRAAIAQRNQSTSTSNISLPDELVNGQEINTNKNNIKSQKIINYENKNFTDFSKYLQHNFGLSRKDVNIILKKDVLALKDSIQKTGKISSSQANEIFVKAWEFGLTRDTTMHDLYPELIDWLKSSKLNYDSTKRALGPGAFDDYRYEARGLLNLSKDGRSIDSLYNELSSEYPDLFDSSINNEADQLNTMLDVASELQVTETPLKNSNLKQYQSGYAEDFHKQLNQYLSTMERAEKIHRERVKKEPQGTLDYETYKTNQVKIKALQRDYDRVMREPFTQKELAYADMIVNKKITISELAEGVNKNTVQKIVDVKAPLVKAKNEIAEAKKKIKYDYRVLAREKTANMVNWKDKINGFAFNREIPERNFIDIAGKEDGQILIDTYITPVHKSEAARNRYISEKFKKIKELGLSKKESELLQQWGEKVIDDNEIIGEGYDITKIKKADSIFRGIYDEVIEKTNEVLIKNGYAPIEKLEDYYRHFSEEEKTPIKIALEKVGFKWDSDKLPTNIAGLTDSFRPGKTWFSSALHRNGKKLYMMR